MADLSYAADLNTKTGFHPYRQAIKRAASDAIMAAGGTISHHHGVGEDHLPWIRAEKGELGIAALRAVKQAFDPKGILNPGKLIPPDLIN